MKKLNMEHQKISANLGIILRLNVLKYFSFLSLFMLLFNFFVFSQEKSKSELDIQQSAFEKFEQKKYNEAIPLFSQLVNLYPKDPKYNYCYGISLVEGNKDIESAVKYLEFASTQNVEANIYYYLGKAYHLNYQFDIAITFYNRFNKKGKKSEIEKLKVDRQISMSNNGKTLVRYADSITVLENKLVKEIDFYKNYRIADFEGRFIDKPVDLKTKKDKKDESIIYFQSEIRENNVVYFASSGKNKKKGKDIFRIIQLENDSWTKPENMGTIINSAFDEDYAYYDADTKTLYFCSMGHNSMGGYDIFKSTYDKYTQSWSEPINMGFPINSPYDDFLFVTDADENIAYFASKRESGQEQIYVYKIRIDEKPVQKEFITLEELLEKSRLNVSPLAKSDSGKAPESYQQEEDNEFSRSPSIINEEKYNTILSEALQLQITADSLFRLVDEKKNSLDSLTNNILKIKKEILDLENQAYSIQKLAEQKYVLARKIEQDQLTSTSSRGSAMQDSLNYPLKDDFENRLVEENEIHEKETQYSDSAKIKSSLIDEQEKISENFVSDSAETDLYEKNAGLNEKSVVEIPGFSILSDCPYSDENPIPIDIDLPGGILYRVQIGVFSKAIPQNAFKGFTPVTGEKTSSGSLTKYFIGLFRSFKATEAAMVKIQNEGFKDAFIVAYYNGERISLNRAKNLEKVQADK